MQMELEFELNNFYTKYKFGAKGKLSVAVFITEQARILGLPLRPEELLTDRQGQVRGLGRSPVQKILKRHDILKVLANEAGRTSRGSIDHMQLYVNFLNEIYNRNLVDFDRIERFWISKVNLHFAAKPLKVKLDASQSVRTLINDLIGQAEIKQKENPGANYVGVILQHLVGAKLDCALGKGHFQHNSASTSDAQTRRSGDFLIDKVVIHVTTAPSELLISRCKENLADGQRPIIVTTKKGMALAEGNAENASVANRIDVFEIEQFISLNIYEFARFEEKKREVAVRDLLKRYNEIVDEFETDPSLQIEVQSERVQGKKK
jgi:Domain of unknown function (DUF4928)